MAPGRKINFGKDKFVKPLQKKYSSISDALEDKGFKRVGVYFSINPVSKFEVKRAIYSDINEKLWAFFNYEVDQETKLIKKIKLKRYWGSLDRITFI